MLKAGKFLIISEVLFVLLAENVDVQQLKITFVSWRQHWLKKGFYFLLMHVPNLGTQMTGLFHLLLIQLPICHLYSN